MEAGLLLPRGNLAIDDLCMSRVCDFLYILLF